MKLDRKKGFTLVEVVLVLAISSLMLVALLAGNGTLRQKSGFSSSVDNLRDQLVGIQNESASTVANSSLQKGQSDAVVFGKIAEYDPSDTANLKVSTLVINEDDPNSSLEKCDTREQPLGDGMLVDKTKSPTPEAIIFTHNPDHVYTIKSARNDTTTGLNPVSATASGCNFLPSQKISFGSTPTPSPTPTPTGTPIGGTPTPTPTGTPPIITTALSPCFTGAIWSNNEEDHLWSKPSFDYDTYCDTGALQLSDYPRVSKDGGKDVAFNLANFSCGQPFMHDFARQEGSHNFPYNRDNLFISPVVTGGQVTAAKFRYEVSDWKPGTVLNYLLCPADGTAGIKGSSIIPNWVPPKCNTKNFTPPTRCHTYQVTSKNLQLNGTVAQAHHQNVLASTAKSLWKKLSAPFNQHAQAAGGCSVANPTSVLDPNNYNAGCQLFNGGPPGYIELNLQSADKSSTATIKVDPTSGSITRSFQ